MNKILAFLTATLLIFSCFAPTVNAVTEKTTSVAEEESTKKKKNEKTTEAETEKVTQKTEKETQKTEKETQKAEKETQKTEKETQKSEKETEKAEKETDKETEKETQKSNKNSLKLHTFDTEDILVKEKEYIYSALFEADLSDISEAILTGIVSCEEVTAYYLHRIQQFNDDYNCFITICDNALEKARERDRQLEDGESDGLLFGVPVVIKDNIKLKGYYTTNGHYFSESSKAKKNADVVDFLLNEGAVIIAKTNMSTDAQDARTSLSDVAGETKNAYNKHLASGGSSGGSAVAVSLNFAAAALGTDTNSSLRLPAALNGCVSLRVETKLISTDGIISLNSSRDTVGAITRTVYDQALMLDVLTEGKYNYTGNLDKNALKGTKIAVLTELTYAQPKSNKLPSESVRSEKNIDDEIITAFENAVKELKKCGAEVIEISMENLFTLASKTFDSNSKATKTAFYKQFEALLNENDIDAVIFPSYLSSPLYSGKDEDGKYHDPWSQTFINNCRALSPCAALPEITVPIGTHSSGAGIGMEIATLKNCEQLLLDIAYSYTLKYDHREIPENAENTYKKADKGTLEEIIDEYLLAANTEPESSAEEETTSPSAENETVPEDKTDYTYKTVLNIIFSDVSAVILLCAVVLLITIKYKKVSKKDVNRKM